MCGAGTGGLAGACLGVKRYLPRTIRLPRRRKAGSRLKQPTSRLISCLALPNSKPSTVVWWAPWGAVEFSTKVLAGFGLAACAEHGAKICPMQVPMNRNVVASGFPQNRGLGASLTSIVGEQPNRELRLATAFRTSPSNLRFRVRVRLSARLTRLNGHRPRLAARRAPRSARRIRYAPRDPEVQEY
jgi:hypothetical protein